MDELRNARTSVRHVRLLKGGLICSELVNKLVGRSVCKMVRKSTDVK